MKRDTVLLITDNLESADMLAHGLTTRKVDVDIAAIGAHLHHREQIAAYTLILVDTDRTDGVVLCRQLRTEYKNPLLFMTYESDERYHLRVYEAGVDECIQKPIGNSLFLAKVDVWLRSVRFLRPQRQLTVKEFALDTPRRRLTTPEGQVVTLTHLELRLLQLFLNNPETVLDAETIIRRVWDDYSLGDSTLLKNLIYRIRRKIEPTPSTPQYLQTAFGGYVFYPACDQINSREVYPPCIGGHDLGQKRARAIAAIQPIPGLDCTAAEDQVWSQLGSKLGQLCPVAQAVVPSTATRAS